MRQMKFRGKQQSWIYGGISIFNGYATIFDENCVANSAYEVDINSVGQFTGFIDKNGHEIFEGDIYENNGYYGLIEWNEQLAQFQLTWRHQRKTAADICFMITKYMECFKNVGNIYDNPEMW